MPPHARIGLVGPNGAGKSSLLRLLAGVDTPDRGTVRATGAVGYLPQERDSLPGETVRAYLARRAGIAEPERRMDELAERLAEDPEQAHAYADALDAFLARGGGDLDTRAQQVLSELGLAAELDRPLNALSGGEAARAALASILLSRFDVLLLDEPTNDLDFAGLARLEAFLGAYDGAVVIVSHDRAFLDRTVTKVVELDEWTHGATEYSGGWSEYEAERARRRARHVERYEGYVSEQERIQEQARRMRQWEERGYGQGRKKKKTKDAKKAFAKKSSEPRAGREAVRAVGASARAHTRSAERRRRRAARARGRRARSVSARAARSGGDVGRPAGGRRGETAAGRRRCSTHYSGACRSFLARAGRGRASFSASSSSVARRSAATVPCSTPSSRRAASTPEDARTLLAKFQLGAGDVLRGAASLSPGERTRAVLALLSARGVNCLVLDEPTNHLDVEAIEELERALADYDGTVLLVTHDRVFLDRFGATRTIEL